MLEVYGISIAPVELDTAYWDVWLTEGPSVSIFMVNSAWRPSIRDRDKKVNVFVLVAIGMPNNGPFKCILLLDQYHLRLVEIRGREFAIEEADPSIRKDAELRAGTFSIRSRAKTTLLRTSCCRFPRP